METSDNIGRLAHGFRLSTNIHLVRTITRKNDNDVNDVSTYLWPAESMLERFQLDDLLDLLRPLKSYR